MSKYCIEFTIYDKETTEKVAHFWVDESCPDCQEALKQLVEVEDKRVRRSGISVIKDRIPILILVDPDYNRTLHFESMKKTIIEYRDSLHEESLSIIDTQKIEEEFQTLQDIELEKE